MAYRVAVGLGANLGDTRQTLRSAAQALARIGDVRGDSRLYRTAPIGPSQPDFLNAVVALETQRQPEQLMADLLDLESELGRIRRERWGPRGIDLDLLWIEGVSVNQPHLTVPHPELSRRRFALCPLLDVYPRAAHPTTGRPYAACLTEVLAQRLDIVADSDWVSRPLANVTPPAT